MAMGRIKNTGRLISPSIIERVGEMVSCAADIRSYGPVNMVSSRGTVAFHRTHIEARQRR